jgi:hypothetical protein
MYKIAINQRDTIDVSKIYAIEQKRWGSTWVRYINDKKIKKISKSRENIYELCVKINIFRLLQKLPKIFPKIEK